RLRRQIQRWQNAANQARELKPLGVPAPNTPAVSVGLHRRSAHLAERESDRYQNVRRSWADRCKSVGRSSARSGDREEWKNRSIPVQLTRWMLGGTREQLASEVPSQPTARACHETQGSVGANVSTLAGSRADLLRRNESG